MSTHSRGSLSRSIGYPGRALVNERAQKKGSSTFRVDLTISWDSWVSPVRAPGRPPCRSPLPWAITRGSTHRPEDRVPTTSGRPPVGTHSRGRSPEVRPIARRTGLLLRGGYFGASAIARRTGLLRGSFCNGGACSGCRQRRHSTRNIEEPEKARGRTAPRARPTEGFGGGGIRNPRSWTTRGVAAPAGCCRCCCTRWFPDRCATDRNDSR
jgi:hypothetical protein